MNQPQADRFSFSMEWKRAKRTRKIKTGGRQAEEESLHAQMIGVQGSSSGAREPGSGPQCWRSLWAHWWWGCTDGLKPGSRLAPLYGLCSLITADECVYVCVCEGEWVGEWGTERGTGVGDVGRREHTSRWQDEKRNLWQILGTIRHNVSAAWQLIRNDTDFSQCNRCCLISPARENPAPATFHAQFNHLKGMKYLMHCKASTAVSLVWKFPSQKYACFM